MTLTLYNTLTQTKSDFTPLIENQISLYVCGMTVYDVCHLGHARIMVVFDMIVRYLRSQGFTVNYVRNITDIDDKIIKRAKENNESIVELTRRYIDAMHADERALNVLPPTHEPKATDHIPQMIDMIDALIKNEHAYVSESGDVYYDVTAFKDYGCLSHQDLSGLQAGQRVEVSEDKHHPLDFVLWKMSKPDEPRWSSPWGEGRPGWHIECSAMSTHFLGSHFDLHGGGFDLQFPHHENEIAQAKPATGDEFAKTWLHVGFLQINREKMSKSLGNFFTVKEVLAKTPAEVVRYFLLSSHYRSQLNYSTDNLKSAHQALSRFYTALRDVPKGTPIQNTEYERAFVEAMNDDFNTPEALAVLFSMTHEINIRKMTDLRSASDLAATLVYLADSLGVLQQSPEAFFKAGVARETVSDIEQLIAERSRARDTKDWVRADEIRNQLHRMGIEIDDTEEGTTWREGDGGTL